MHYDHRDHENNSNKSAGGALGFADTRNCGGICSIDGSIPPTKPDPKNLEIGQNQICVKADKVNSKFCMIKDYVTLRSTFCKYRIAIPTREEWGKIGLINSERGMSGSQMKPVISKGLGQKFAITKAKYSGTFRWDRMLQPFRQRLQQYWTV